LPILNIPDPSLVLLIGPSGAGKSTFAARHFQPTEVISSDRCRAMIIDDETDQSVSGEAFSLLRHIARARLGHGRLTVVDATNLQSRSRRPFLRMGRALQIPVVAIVFNLPPEKYLHYNLARHRRQVPPDVIAQHFIELQAARVRLKREGYSRIYELSEEMIGALTIERNVGSR
jgi:protein phosphatase